jgi:hypothetical protein
VFIQKQTVWLKGKGERVKGKGFEYILYPQTHSPDHKESEKFQHLLRNSGNLQYLSGFREKGKAFWGRFF